MEFLSLKLSRGSRSRAGSRQLAPNKNTFNFPKGPCDTLKTGIKDQFSYPPWKCPPWPPHLYILWSFCMTLPHDVSAVLKPSGMGLTPTDKSHASTSSLPLLPPTQIKQKKKGGLSTRPKLVQYKYPTQTNKRRVCLLPTWALKCSSLPSLTYLLTWMKDDVSVVITWRDWSYMSQALGVLICCVVKDARFYERVDLLFPSLWVHPSLIDKRLEWGWWGLYQVLHKGVEGVDDTFQMIRVVRPRKLGRALHGMGAPCKCVEQKKLRVQRRFSCGEGSPTG